RSSVSAGPTTIASPTARAAAAPHLQVPQAVEVQSLHAPVQRHEQNHLRTTALRSPFFATAPRASVPYSSPVISTCSTGQPSSLLTRCVRLWLPRSRVLSSLA